MSVLQLDTKRMTQAAAAIVCRAQMTEPAQILRLCQTFNKIITDNLETYARRYNEPRPVEADLWVFGLTIGRVLEALGEPIISTAQALKLLDCALYNTEEEATEAIIKALMVCLIDPDQDLETERRRAQNDPDLFWA